MPKAATDVMQEIIVSAVLDSLTAFKASAKGVPNVLVREMNAVHPNTTLEDLPPEVRSAVAASVRDAFARLRKEGYTVAGTHGAPPARTPPPPQRDRPSGGAPANPRAPRPAPRPHGPPPRRPR